MMNSKWPVQLKAAFFLFVFVLNTGVGLACAIGNNKIHHHQSTVKAHEHKHSSTPIAHGCCSDELAKIIQADKVIPQTIQFANPVFITAFAGTYYNVAILLFTQISTVNNYYLNRYRLPVPDIRIAICSFRI